MLGALFHTVNAREEIKVNEFIPSNRKTTIKWPVVVFGAIFPGSKENEFQIEFGFWNFRWPVCYLPHKYASCSLTFVSIHLIWSSLEHIRPFISTHKTYLRFPSYHTVRRSIAVSSLALSVCLSFPLSLFLVRSFNSHFSMEHLTNCYLLGIV